MKKEVPNTYYEKYDTDTVDKLIDLLDSLDHIVHIANGIKADILNGNYTREQAELDAENLMYVEGVDIFSALDDVVYAEWQEKESA